MTQPVNANEPQHPTEESIVPLIDADGDFDGDQRVISLGTPPPGLREAERGSFHACGSCVFFTGEQCSKYGNADPANPDISGASGYPVDRRDVCDSWKTLTPRLTEARVADILEGKAEPKAKKPVKRKGNPLVEKALRTAPHESMAKLAAMKGQGADTEDVLPHVMKVGHWATEHADILNSIASMLGPDDGDNDMDEAAAETLRELATRQGFDADLVEFGVHMPSLVHKPFSEGLHPRKAGGGEFANKGIPHPAVAENAAARAARRAKRQELEHRLNAVAAQHKSPSNQPIEHVRADIAEREQRVRDAEYSHRLDESRVRGILGLEEVKSDVYPGLDRSPKQNWVDKAGGLPNYIERIAKHVHYEHGKAIGTAIAIAVGVCKRWCAGGSESAKGAAKGESPKAHVSAKTRALACKAVAEWEAKKASTHVAEAHVSPRALREATFEAAAGDFLLGYSLALLDFKPLPPSWNYTCKVMEAVYGEHDDWDDLLEALDEEERIEEGFDPAKHPRVRGGKFANTADLKDIHSELSKYGKVLADRLHWDDEPWTDSEDGHTYKHLLLAHVELPPKPVNRPGLRPDRDRHIIATSGKGDTRAAAKEDLERNVKYLHGYSGQKPIQEAFDVGLYGLMPHAFDASKHLRGRGGKFRDMLDQIDKHAEFSHIKSVEDAFRDAKLPGKHHGAGLAAKTDEDHSLAVDETIGQVLAGFKGVKDWDVDHQADGWHVHVKLVDGEHHVVVGEDGSVKEHGAAQAAPVLKLVKPPQEVSYSPGQYESTGDFNVLSHMTAGTVYKGNDGHLYKHLGDDWLNGKKGPVKGAKTHNLDTGVVKTVPYFVVHGKEYEVMQPKGAGQPKPLNGPTSAEVSFQALLDSVKATNSLGEEIKSLKGMNVVVTGVIPGHTRNEVHKMISAAGGYPQTGVTLTTNLLVTGDKVGATKINKAKKSGTKVIDWSSFKHLVESEIGIAKTKLVLVEARLEEATTGLEIATLRARKRVLETQVLEESGGVELHESAFERAAAFVAARAKLEV